MNRTRERRVAGNCELRTIPTDSGGSRKITGHAAVFDTLSEKIFGFRERISPGAFQPALARSDIRALLNHDPNYVLGRTRNGTLSVWEDQAGLAVEIDPPATQWASDLLVSIDRGDISQMSFSFRVAEDRWETVEGVNHRTILSFEEIYDVSPVTYPAYPETDVALRAHGSLQPETERIIREHLRILQSLIDIPARSGGESEAMRSRSLNQLVRRLRILELEHSTQEDRQ